MGYQRLHLCQMLLDLVGLTRGDHPSLLPHLIPINMPRHPAGGAPPPHMVHAAAHARSWNRTAAVEGGSRGRFLPQAKRLDWINACRVERETPRILAIDAFETVLANRC